jgi:hypothetical protein
LFVCAVSAAGDKKEGDSTKTKRAYSLGYTSYDHDFIDHAPIVAHAPITAVHHAPIVAAAPIIKAAPIIAAAPYPLARVTSSVVSTNVHHYPSSYVAHAPLIAPSVYHAPAAYHAAAYHAPGYHAPAAYHAAAYPTAYHAPLVASPYSTIYHR